MTKSEEIIMEIKTVSIIGLGALGVLFGKQMTDSLEKGQVRVIADPQRINKYKKEGIYSNDQICNFKYVTPGEISEPADLVIFMVKFNALRDAAIAMKSQIGPDTIIMSALNGISSEKILGEIYGMDNIVYCVAQGMDAVKVGNQLTYTQMGKLCFGESPVKGEREKSREKQKIDAVAAFFSKAGIPYEIVSDATHMIWSKFMLNVGVNQVVAYYEGNYGTVQAAGEARNMMLDSMREVTQIAPYEGINLSEKDIEYWMQVLATLSAEGKPSLRQDMEAKRKSEVDLFSGTVRELGKKYGVSTPVNNILYKKIKEIEVLYNK